MRTPKVSVIMPVYGGAPHLAESIGSVLAQTYDDFELVIVNDASPDDSASVVKQFHDPRIKYLEHPSNRGSSAARNTGIRSSTGDILAFLDQDDILVPHKLEAHVAFLERNPSIGVSYNSRFELLHSYPSQGCSPADMVQDLWRPPRRVTIADMVLGFPFGPTDTVIRREWAFRVDLWPDYGQFAGAEIDFAFNLWLAGCQFASVDRALSYRRPHSGKAGNIARWCADEIRTQQRVFDDPRCPQELRALRHTAHVNLYLGHAYQAFAQEETSLGQSILRQAISLQPGILSGMPCRLVQRLVEGSIANDGLDHEQLLRSVFAQLPAEASVRSEQLQWAVQRGYVRKGVRALIWGRDEDGRRYLERAKELHALLDEPFLRWLAQKLLDYETERGPAATKAVLQALAPYLADLGGKEAARFLAGCYAANLAFERYRAGDYAAVPANVFRAVVSDPAYLGNRGVLSILLRSVTGLRRPAWPQTSHG